MAALGLELYEQRDALLPPTTLSPPKNTCLSDELEVYQLLIPLVVASTMAAVVFMFLCSSVVVCVVVAKKLLLESCLSLIIYEPDCK